MRLGATTAAALIVAGATLMVSTWSFAAEGVDVSITPRFQYFMVNPTGFAGNANDQFDSERIEIPFPGLTIGVRPQTLKNTEFLLSGFYGEDDGVRSSAGTVSTDVTRLDLELLARHAIPDTSLNFFYGGRAILAQQDGTVTGGTFAATGLTTQEDEISWYLAELGIGFSTALTSSGKHLAFGGITGLLGYQEREVQNRRTALGPDESGLAYGADLQVGYQHIFSEKMAAHVRYRALLLSNQHGGQGGDKLLVGHGPEVGVTFRF